VGFDPLLLLVEQEDGKAFRSPVHPEIRLIDFGGATFEDDYHTKIINTRQYRSPEVVLGLFVPFWSCL
jgi:serine/threonine protein kinase